MRQHDGSLVGVQKRKDQGRGRRRRKRGSREPLLSVIIAENWPSITGRLSGGGWPPSKPTPLSPTKPFFVQALTSSLNGHKEGREEPPS